MKLLLYYEADLYIPEIGISLSHVSFYWLSIFVMIMGMFIGFWGDYYQHTLPYVALNMLPIEIIAILIMAQYYFIFAVILFMITLSVLLFWLWAVKKYLPSKPEEFKLKMNKLIAWQTIGLVLSIVLISNIAVINTGESLINTTVKASSLSYIDLDNQVSQETFLLIAPLKENIWQNLPPEERIDVLQTLLNIEVSHLKLNPLHLKTKKIDTARGYYIHERNTVYIDYEVLLNESAEVCIDIICHEAYHAFQYTSVDSIDFTNDPRQASFLFEEVQSWRENINNYYFAPIAAYYYQPLEKSARAYASQSTEFYLEQIEKLNLAE